MDIRIAKIEIDAYRDSPVAARLVVRLGPFVIRNCALVATFGGLRVKKPQAGKAKAETEAVVEITDRAVKDALHAAAMAAFEAMGGTPDKAMAAAAARAAKVATAQAAE